MRIIARDSLNDAQRCCFMVYPYTTVQVKTYDDAQHHCPGALFFQYVCIQFQSFQILVLQGSLLLSGDGPPIKCCQT